MRSSIALRHRVTDVRVFGSVLHGNDADGSDLDILLEPSFCTALQFQNKLFTDTLGIRFQIMDYTNRF